MKGINIPKRPYIPREIGELIPRLADKMFIENMDKTEVKGFAEAVAGMAVSALMERVRMTVFAVRDMGGDAGYWMQQFYGNLTSDSTTSLLAEWGKCNEWYDVNEELALITGERLNKLIDEITETFKQG